MSFLDLEIGTSSEPLTGTVEAAPSTTLVTVEQANVQTVFTEPRALDPLIEHIAQAVREHVPDTTTAKGRKEIASLAAKVAKTKTYLDDLGKTLVAGLKELPKKIDANRLDMRTRLDALRDEARKPLDDWEAEQARIEAQRKAEEEAAALVKEIDFTHEIALLMNADLERKREDAKRAAEQAQRDHEEQIRLDAEVKAQREAEDRAQAEREAGARREVEAKLAQEKAEREKAEAEQRAKDAEAKYQRERQEADEREEHTRKEAIESERLRQEAEARRVKAEQEAREADQEHRRTFNRESVADLVSAGIAEETAKAVVTAILMKKVRHISIAY